MTALRLVLGILEAGKCLGHDGWKWVSRHMLLTLNQVSSPAASTCLAHGIRDVRPLEIQPMKGHDS
jgi:hypothetical protein